jgi:RNA polymerase sigma-70 factor (family 1)
MSEHKDLIIDLENLESLFGEHYTFLCTVAYYMTGDESTAKDIVQEFFYYCWKKRKELSIAINFKGYASRAVKNACLNYLKSSRRTTLDPDFLFGLQHITDQSAQSAEEDLTERDKALWEAIDKLPPQRRLIFLLSNKDSLTYAQIAAQLNISINTVKTQIRLAYQFLREECRWLVGLFLFIHFFNGRK